MAAGDANPVLRRWDERLANWALWFAGADSLGGGSAYDGEFGDTAPRPPPPLVGIALDTDMLVRQLSISHFEAVKAVYVWTGTMLERAQFLGIHPDTLTDRCTAAKWQLEDMDQKRRLAMVKPPKALA